MKGKDSEGSLNAYRISNLQHLFYPSRRSPAFFVHDGECQFGGIFRRRGNGVCPRLDIRRILHQWNIEENKLTRCELQVLPFRHFQFHLKCRSRTAQGNVLRARSEERGGSHREQGKPTKPTKLNRSE